MPKHTPAHAAAPKPPLHLYLSPGTDADVADRYAGLPAAAAQALGLEDASEELAFLDVETTGFDPVRDAVIEIAVLIARGPEVVARFSTLVDPGSPVPREATQLTGIDDAAVAGAPRIESAVAEALDLVGGRDIVAHSASFDEAFITGAAGRIGRLVPAGGSIRSRWRGSVCRA
jgi:DNA polymerase III epsilon subunit-like protein